MNAKRSHSASVPLNDALQSSYPEARLPFQPIFELTAASSHVYRPPSSVALPSCTDAVSPQMHAIQCETKMSRIPDLAIAICEYGIAISHSQRWRMREPRSTRSILSRRERRIRRITRRYMAFFVLASFLRMSPTRSKGSDEQKSTANHERKYVRRILRRSLTRRLPRLGSG